MTDAGRYRDRAVELGAADAVAFAIGREARPAFHSVGIDVFSTVHAFDLPLAPLRDEGDEQNWYSAVFIR